jgi:uncharacterized membrane protein YgcG
MFLNNLFRAILQIRSLAINNGNSSSQTHSDTMCYVSFAVNEFLSSSVEILYIIFILTLCVPKLAEPTTTRGIQWAMVPVVVVSFGWACLATALPLFMGTPLKQSRAWCWLDEKNSPLRFAFVYFGAALAVIVAAGFVLWIADTDTRVRKWRISVFGVTQLIVVSVYAIFTFTEAATPIPADSPAFDAFGIWLAIHDSIRAISFVIAEKLYPPQVYFPEVFRVLTCGRMAISINENSDLQTRQLLWEQQQQQLSQNNNNNTANDNNNDNSGNINKNGKLRRSARKLEEQQERNSLSQSGSVTVLSHHHHQDDGAATTTTAAQNEENFSKEQKGEIPAAATTTELFQNNSKRNFTYRSNKENRRNEDDDDDDSVQNDDDDQEDEDDYRKRHLLEDDDEFNNSLQFAAQEIVDDTLTYFVRVLQRNSAINADLLKHGANSGGYGTLSGGGNNRRNMNNNNRGSRRANNSNRDGDDSEYSEGGRGGGASGGGGVSPSNTNNNNKQQRNKKQQQHRNNLRDSQSEESAYQGGRGASMRLSQNTRLSSYDNIIISSMNNNNGSIPPPQQQNQFLGEQQRR